jgi:hypothetical protein
MGRTGMLVANRTAHKEFYLWEEREPGSYFPGQFFGAHMAGGAPPSAKDTVETAPSNSTVARIKRTIFFMKPPVVEIVPLERHPMAFLAGA